MNPKENPNRDNLYVQEEPVQPMPATSQVQPNEENQQINLQPDDFRTSIQLNQPSQPKPIQKRRQSVACANLFCVGSDKNVQEFGTDHLPKVYRPRKIYVQRNESTKKICTNGFGGSVTVNNVDSLFRAKKPMDEVVAASTQIAKTINPTNSVVTISRVDNLNPGFHHTQSGSKGLLSSANSNHLDLNNVAREQ